MFSVRLVVTVAIALVFATRVAAQSVIPPDLEDDSAGQVDTSEPIAESQDPGISCEVDQITPCPDDGLRTLPLEGPPSIDPPLPAPTVAVPVILDTPTPLPPLSPTPDAGLSIAPDTSAPPAIQTSTLTPTSAVTA